MTSETVIRPIPCAEILEVGKKIFAASSVKKMSRFEEVSPEEIKRIVDNATPINTKRSTKYGPKIFISKARFIRRTFHVPNLMLVLST